ncbi:hypothetical protein F4680DRAFT_449338 [Xylaria scruposa]|nr:hypothetical protein F4680DRAFT_449338 [Xylaria scruposa]
MDREPDKATSEPPPQGEETGLASPPTAETIVTVETNDFRRVLDHFDGDGNLIDEARTLLSIPCPICYENDLSLINPHCEGPPDTTHEPYAVLMRCGHAFGYKCISHWFLVRRLNVLRCPLCRESVYCERQHTAPLEMYGGTTDMDLQRQQIKKIRELLTNPICEGCSPNKSDHAHPDPLPIVRQVALVNRSENNRRAATMHQAIIQTYRFMVRSNPTPEELSSRLAELRYRTLQAWATRYGIRILPLLPPNVSIEINIPSLPATAPDNQATPSAASAPVLDSHHRDQPTAERSIRAATEPPTFPENSEDQARETTVTFGYAFVQSPDRYWQV